MIAQLEKWIRGQVYNARSSGECRQLVLRHLVLGGKLGPAVTSVDIDKDHQTESGIEALSNEIELIAMSDAHGLGGMQQYCLQSYHGTSEKQSARFTFRMDGSDSSDTPGSDFTEPATSTGILSQQMRHNELILKSSTVAMAGMIQTQAHTIQKMAERMDNMESERIKSLDIFQEIMLASSEQKLSERKQDHREQMSRELLKKAGPLLGVIASKVTGGKLLPMPVKEGLGALFDGLKDDPARAAKIMQLLLPEERALLAEFMNLSEDTEKSA